MRPSALKARSCSCSNDVSNSWRSSPTRACTRASVRVVVACCTSLRRCCNICSTWTVPHSGPSPQCCSCPFIFAHLQAWSDTSARSCWTVSAKLPTVPLSTPTSSRRKATSELEAAESLAFSSPVGGGVFSFAPRSTGKVARSASSISPSSATSAASRAAVSSGRCPRAESCSRISCRRFCFASVTARCPAVRRVSNMARTPVMSTWRCVCSSMSVCRRASSCSAMLAVTMLTRRFSASHCVFRSSSSASSKRARRAITSPDTEAEEACEKALVSMLRPPPLWSHSLVPVGVESTIAGGRSEFERCLGRLLRSLSELTRWAVAHTLPLSSRSERLPRLRWLMLRPPLKFKTSASSATLAPRLLKKSLMDTRPLLVWSSIWNKATRSCVSL
mmetsp:Transcript_79727/g.205086  ORF Transcript_79727/g.205086 Transcript_79727/m.205086 type:complete len:390 (+) Transcript_79727:1639-2808(+)